MFRCEHTGELIGPGVPENRIVTERRKKTYEKKIRKGRRIVGVELVEGWEIVKEIRVGPKAYQQLTGKTPQLRVERAPVTRRETRSRWQEDERKPKKKPWRNPKGRKGATTRSAGSTSPGSSTKKQFKNSNKSSTKSQGSERRKPVVQKVNPIKVVKE